MIKITGSKVAIIPVENPDKIGHIIVPEISKDRLNQGFVKYRGPLTRHAKIGDYVLFSGYTGTLMHVEDEGKLIIMPEKFIVATIENLNAATEIPGLYFRDYINSEANKLALCEILYKILPDLEEDHIISITESLHEHGVFAPEQVPYYTASYEQTMNYIAQAFSELPKFRDSIKVLNKNPVIDDVNQDERNSFVVDEEDEDGAESTEEL